MLIVPVAAVPLWAASKATAPLLLLGGAAVLGVASGGWFLLGRRQRGDQGAQRLGPGRQEALALVRQEQNRGLPSPLWEGRFRNLEGECQRQAGELALGEQRFEDA